MFPSSLKLEFDLWYWPEESPTSLKGHSSLVVARPLSVILDLEDSDIDDATLTEGGTQLDDCTSIAAADFFLDASSCRVVSVNLLIKF